MYIYIYIYIYILLYYQKLGFAGRGDRHQRRAPLQLPGKPDISKLPLKLPGKPEVSTPRTAGKIRNSHPSNCRAHQKSAPLQLLGKSDREFFIDNLLV